METKKEVGNVVETLIDNGVKRATKYISEKFVISAQRKSFKGKIRKGENIEIVMKIGKPNFAEREFIKQCKKAGEPFPVKKIQLKHFK